MSMTFLQALDCIATNPSGTSRAFADEVANTAREVRKKEVDAGTPHSVPACQADAYLRWYDVHKDYLE